MGETPKDEEQAKLFKLFQVILGTSLSLPQAEVATIDEILDVVKQSYRQEIKGYVELHRHFAEMAAEKTKERPTTVNDYEYYSIELKHKILADIYENLLKRI